MQTLLFSVAFALVITFAEEIFFQRPQSFYLTFLLDRRGPDLLPGLISTVAALLIPAMLAWLAYTLTRRKRLLALPLLILPVMVETAYQHVFLRWLSVFDINTALSSPPTLWSSAFDLYFSQSMVFLVVIYLSMLLVPPRSRPAQPLFPAITLAICLVAVTASQVSGFSTNWGTSIPQFYQTVARWSLTDSKPIVREKLAYHSTAAPAQNIVLIIDESIRGDHLSLNGYPRSTTPDLDRLAAIPGLVHNWGVAASGATCSQLANALLLTGVRPDPAQPEAIQTLPYQYPTLFDYARAMGYQTFYLDAQTNLLWNGLTLEDATHLTQWITIEDLGSGEDRDLRAADWIHEKVNSSAGNLIVLNKKGVHFIYEDSYPPEYAAWGPLPENYHNQPELAKNPYDNGIFYNVNEFFKRLLPAHEQTAFPTFYLYTSDHGQTLFEGGADWLHCNDSRLEAAVPLVLIGRLEQQPDLSVAASHSHILPTLLDLMGVPESGRAHSYAPSLLRSASLASPERYFVSGDGRVIAYDETP